jgi:hypothetical protein
MKIKTAKLFSSIALSAGLVGTSGLLSAQTIVWEKIHRGSPLDFLYESSSSNRSSDLSYRNKWNILNDGYVANSSISELKVWFKFADDAPGRFDGAERLEGGDVEEYVDITLGNTKIWDNLEVDGRHPSTTYASYFMMLDPILHASIFSDLMMDGELSYTVVLQDMARASFGREDTYVKEAGLRASFTPKPQTTSSRVSDGGASFALLGMSLLGLAGLRISVKPSTEDSATS